MKTLLFKRKSRKNLNDLLVHVSLIKSATVTNPFIWADRLSVNSVGKNNYYIQVVQPGSTLEQGKTYRLVYDAHAYSDRVLNVNAGMPVEPYTTFLSDIVEGNSEVNLTSSKQTFMMDFFMSEPTYEDSRVEFSVGTYTPTVYVDNVSIYEIVPSSSNHMKTNNLETKKMIVRQKGNRVNVVRSDNYLVNKKADNVCSFDVANMPKGFCIIKFRSGNSIMKSGFMLIGK